MNQGVVVVGYQGIGKSTLAKENLHYLDLESSNFYMDMGNRRYDDWYVPYCHIAIDLARQGHVVFVSSHEVVRKYLKSLIFPEGVHLMCCVPSIALKNEWICKLDTRARYTDLDKDYRAWADARGHYVENIQEILDDIPVSCVLSDPNYTLETELQSKFQECGWPVYT